MRCTVVSRKDQGSRPTLWEFPRLDETAASEGAGVQTVQHDLLLVCFLLLFSLFSFGDVFSFVIYQKAYSDSPYGLTKAEIPTLGLNLT